MPRFVVGSDEAADRIDKLLVTRLPGTSRATIQRWIAERRVLVDGRPCRGKDVPKPGSTIDVDWFRSSSRPSRQACRFRYCSGEHLIVVDKPARRGPSQRAVRRHVISGALAQGGFSTAKKPSVQPKERCDRYGSSPRQDTADLVVAKDATREAQGAAIFLRPAALSLTLGVPRTA
jgi:23S rRNA-/tRNA-specific pseudouridylate synthase